MCLCEKAGQRCNELCSRWGYHNHTNTAIKSSQTENHVQYSSPPILVQNENKPLVTCAVDTGDSSICSCEDTDEYSKSPIQSNTELNVFTSKDQCPWTESALQNCCRWIMEQANKTGIRLETTTNPCCEQTRVISRANSSIKPTSSEQQHADREQYCSCAEQQTCAEDCVGRQPCASEPCATPPCSPISTSFTEPPPHGPENPCQCPCCMAECCRKACCPFKQNSVEPQNSSIRSLPLPPVCSDIEQNIQTADKLLPILENIYEILQCIRDERLHQSIVSREQSEHQRDSDSLKKYCVDLPPPMPPPSPSFMRQLNFTHAPPLNIYISPMPTHRSNDPSSLQAAEELCAHVSLETPRYIEEREPMYALDPPERDVDVEEVARSEGNTRKLIPVDMDLMRADDDFELTPACRVSVECQVHTNSLEDIDINGCLRETSTQMLKFPVKKCLCTDAELKACLEACQKQREELDMKSCQRESKASRISSTVNVLSDQPGGEQERKASKISSTANVLSDQLGVEQASMMSKISSTINVSDQLGGKRASKTSKISSTINVLSDQPGVVKQASKTSKISSTINVLSDQPGVVKQASKTSKISSTINVSDQLEGERDSKPSKTSSKINVLLAQPRDSALNKPNTNTKVSSEQLLEEIQKSEPSEPVPSKPLETKPRHSESSSVNFRQTDYEHRISKLLSVDINNHPRNKSITSSQINFPLRTEDTVSNMCLISRLSKIDAGTDRPEFDYENKISSACQCQPEPTQVNLPEMCEFIDSILNDLEAMKLAREKSFGCQKPVKNPNQPNQWQTQSQQQQNQWQTQSQHQQSQWQKPPTGLSYPLTIEKVVQLGTNSLFVKWSVQNLNNIAGYEVFVDGHLTNRYFSPIHRAAVICEVKLHCQHRIIVRAQPAFICSDSIQSSCALSDDPSLSSYNPGASSPQPDGSIWYPSVYHFEPNIYSPPTNTDFNDSGVVKT